MPKTIAATSEVAAVFDDRGGDHLLITFAPLDFQCATDEFWGQQFAGKAGFSAIGFVPRRNNWYPAADMHRLITELEKNLQRFPYRISYGSSMGAYGALKYSRRLGVSTAVTFGAQTSIDPGDGIVDTAYTRYFQNALHEQMSIKSQDVAENAHLFFDPQIDFDLQNAARIMAAAPHLKTIPLPYAGHDCIKIAAGTVSMARLILACLEGDLANVKSLARGMRANSGARLSGIAQALAPRRPDCAQRLVDNRRDAMDGKQAGLCHDALANAYLRLNDLPNALAAAAAAYRLLPARSSIVRTRAVCLEKAGQLEESVQFYERYNHLNPHDGLVRNSLARCYLRLGRLALARETSQIARSLQPEHPSVIACAAAINAAIDKADADRTDV